MGQYQDAFEKIEQAIQLVPDIVEVLKESDKSKQRKQSITDIKDSANEEPDTKASVIAENWPVFMEDQKLLKFVEAMVLRKIGKFAEA